MPKSISGKPRLNSLPYAINDYPELGVVNFSPFLDAAHDPVSEVDQKEPAIARNFRLKGIHPNPFRKQVSISFEIGRVVPVTVRILNLLGQEIKTITQQKFIPGVYELSWDGSDQRGSQVATGVYLFEFSVENQRITRRILRIN
ncbi:T9SS type A sorting domain-containing protein [candidate division KSB1 bacterium]|nr:T9SS type A sorting domain-containing protein [candidate division KSB1 bacterium]